MADQLGWSAGRKVTVTYRNGDLQTGVFASPALIVGPDMQPFAIVLVIQPKRTTWQPAEVDAGKPWAGRWTPKTTVTDLPTYRLTILVAAIRSYRLEPEPTDLEGDPDNA